MKNEPTASAELPRYRCHKEVHALKIAEVIPLPNPDVSGRSGASSYGATIIPSDKRYAAFNVPADYVQKHKPEVGGYYVIYADGYKSFSPAKPFEDGYTLIAPVEIKPGARISRALRLDVPCLDRLVLRLTHRIWNRAISRILCRAYSEGHIKSSQMHTLAAAFDPTQRHSVY